MEDVLIPLIVMPILFVALPWLILHYVTKWKVNSSLTGEDEKMLDELYELARRLEERMNTIDRIMQADNPGWHPVGYDHSRPSLEKPSVSDFEPRRSSVPSREERM
ncbi:MAG: envelope stress response membrane protein PspB [Allosphingosinicella sp.]|uniref:envelope stress response membrane protein PspB n=1 Tax=Allosphingosinicella sp. TaxID=2823234 RepID=UPI0039437632